MKVNYTPNAMSAKDAINIITKESLRFLNDSIARALKGGCLLLME